MSVYSETPDNQNSTDYDVKNHLIKNKSKGLSGGAIAAIVICSILVLAIVGILFALIRSGKICGKKEIDINRSSSTLHGLAVNY